MANALTYIANIGKSVTYSAVDKIKDMNPIVTEFAEQNSELGKVLYESVKDFKGTAKKAYKYGIESKVGEAGRETIKSLFEDIKTGKLYNRERIDLMQTRSAGSLLSDFEFDDDPFKDIDMSDSGSDFNFDDDFEIGDDDKFLADQIDQVGEKTANAVAIATGKSAEYIVESGRGNTRALQKHNEYLVGKVTIGMGAINSSIASIMEFNQKVLKVHVDNSQKFYETTTSLDKERNELLKKLVDTQVNMYKSTVPQASKSSKIKYSDIVAGYTPDLKMYGKKIFQNFNSLTGGVMDMNNMFEDGNLLLNIAGSPLKFITDTLVKKMTPKLIENTMKDLNDTLSGFFGSLMSKFSTMKNDDEGNFITRWLGELFGIESSTKSTIDTSKYNKGAIPFDGETKMAITQVIPMQLSKIEAALTGQTERLFDYKKGAFTDLEKVKKEYDNINRSYSDRASSEIRQEIEELLKDKRLGYQNDKKLREQMTNAFERSYTNGTLLNLNKEGLTPYDVGMDDYRSFETMKSLMKHVKKSTKMKYNARVWEQKAAQERMMLAEEQDPTSIYRIMANGFNVNQYANKKDGKYLKAYDLNDSTKVKDNATLQNNLVYLKDNKGNNMYYYLQRLTEDVEKIRFRLLSDSDVPVQPITTKGKKKGKGTYSPTSDYSKYNNPIKGIEVPSNFKTQNQVDNAQEIRNEERYNRETDRIKEKSLAFDRNVNGGKPFTKEQWIAGKRRALKNTKGFNEEEFNEKFVKNAEAEVKKLNRSFMSPKGYMWDDRDYDGMDEDEYTKEFDSTLNADEKFKKSMREINEGIEETKKKTLGSSIKKKLMESDKIGEGLKNFVIGMDNLSKKPVRTIAGILQRVDERMYEVIYGDEKDSKDKLSPKSFMGSLVAKLTSTFNSTTEFLKNNILIPIKDLVLGKDISDKVSEWGKRITDFFGLDTDKAKKKSKDFVKDMFSQPFAYVKQVFSDVYNPLYKSARNVLSGEETAKGLGERLQVASHNEDVERKGREIAASPLATLTPEQLLKTKGKNPRNRIVKSNEDVIIENVSDFLKNNNDIGEYDDVKDQVSNKNIIQDIIKRKLSNAGENFIFPGRNKFAPAPLKSKTMTEQDYIRASIKAGKSISELRDEGYNEVIDRMRLKGFARGARNIKKTGIAVVSEGEMIVPSEDNPYYTGKTDKKEQERKEGIIQKQFNKIMNRFSKSKQEYKGIEAFKDGEENVKVNSDGFTDNHRNGEEKTARAFRTKSIKADSDDADAADVEYETERLRYDSRNYIEEPLTAKSIKVGKKGINSVLKRLGLKGKEFKDKLKLKTKMEAVGDKLDELAGSEDSDELFNAAVKDVTGDFTKYLPGVLGGGLLGTGISLITGAIGGPLVGAAVGAATSLVTQSDKVKDWIFGKIDKKTGERQGNVLSKDLSKNIQKYFPNMAKGATVGGITSILPFVPGGPVAGIIVGSAIGFASKSEKIQAMLFGNIIDDEGNRDNKGLIKPELIKSLKESIPEMTLGGIAGVVAGPFGLVGNIALGASIGYLSKTKKFQEALFGKEVTDEDGNITYEGGILGTIKTKFVDPIVSSVQPLGKQLELGVKGIFGGLSSIFHNIFDEELRIPLRKFFKEKFFDKGVSAITGLVKAAINPAINAASLPFKAIGGVGNYFRRRQIANGDADYMTAEERVQYREDRLAKGKHKLFGRTFERGQLKNDEFKGIDEMLVDMNTDDLNKLNDAMKFLNNPTESADNLRKDSIHKINKAVNNDFGLDYGASRSILKHLRNDDVDKAYDVIRRSGLNEEDQRKLSSIIAQEHSQYGTANSIKDNTKMAKDTVFKKLQGLGLKGFKDENLDKINKLVGQEVQVRKNQTPEVWKDNQDQKRHEQIVGLFDKLIATIKDLQDPNNKAVESLTRSRFQNNMREASKKRGFLSMFDSGNSNIFGKDYKYDYEVDEDGQGHYFRYEVDEKGNMLPDTKTFVNEEGDPFDKENNPVLQPGNKDTKLNKFGFRTAKKIAGGIKSATGFLWNTSLGNMAGNAVKNKYQQMVDKKDQRIQDQIQSKYEWDQRNKALFGKDIFKKDGDSEEEEENVTYRNDLFGNPIKWIKTKDRWERADNDNENKEFEKQTSPIRSGFGAIVDKIGGLAADIKDGFFNLLGIKEEDGTGKKIAKMALGAVGLLTAAGAANVLENWWDKKAAPTIHSFWEEKIFPRIQQYLEPLQPTMARAAVGIDRAINSIPSAIDKLGTRIRGFIVDDLPRIWATKIIPFYEGGIDWLAGKVEKITEGATYLMGKLLPGILKGFAKGAWNLLKGDIFNFFGGYGRRDSHGLLGTSSSKSTTEPEAQITTSNGGFAEDIYKNIFGTSASNDLQNKYGVSTNSSVSDNALESYYSLKTSTNPRSDSYESQTNSNFNSSSSSGSTGTGLGTTSRMNNTLSSLFSNSSINSFADYSESTTSSDAISVDNQVASNYDKEVEANNATSSSKTQNNTSSLLNKATTLVSGFKNKYNNIGTYGTTATDATGIVSNQGEYIYDQSGNMYYDNGDGTATSMDDGSSVFNISDITNGFTKNSTGTRYLKSLGRAALTGNGGVFKKIAELNSKLLIKNPKGLMSHSWNLLNKGATVGFKGLDKVANTTKNLALKGTAKATGETAVEKTTRELAESTLEGIGENASSKIASKIDDFFAKMASNGIIKKFVKIVLKVTGKDSAEGAAKKVIQDIATGLKSHVDELSEGILKKSSKLAARLVPIMNWTFAIYDFYDGWNNAASYLGIDESEVTKVYRLICAFASFLNGKFLLGLVPLSTLVDICVRIILPIFNVDTTDFQELQAATKNELDTYNATHGTDYDLREYNYKVNGTGGNIFQSIYNKIKVSYKPTAQEQMDADTALVKSSSTSVTDYMLKNGYTSSDMNFDLSANGSGLLSTAKYNAYSAGSSSMSYNKYPNIIPISNKVYSAGATNYSTPFIPYNPSYSNLSRFNKSSSNKSAAGSNLNKYSKYIAAGSGLSRYNKYSGGVSIDMTGKPGFLVNELTTQGPNIVEEAARIISMNETNQNYGAVVANDGGSMSIGKYQFNANAGRAIKVLNAICKKIPSDAKQILGTTLYNKFSKNSSLSGYIPNNAEANAIGKLLITTAGMEIQDQIMLQDVNGYINDGKSKGINDPKALIYYADLYHQRPSNAKTTASYLKRNYPNAINLANIHQSCAYALPSYFNSFKDRRNKTYELCAASTVTSNVTAGYTASGINTGSSYVDIYAGSDDLETSTQGNTWYSKLFSKLSDLGNYFFGFGDNSTTTSTDSTTSSDSYGYIGTEQNTDVKDNVYLTDTEKSAQDNNKSTNKTKSYTDIMKDKAISDAKNILNNPKSTTEEKSSALAAIEKTANIKPVSIGNVQLIGAKPLSEMVSSGYKKRKNSYNSYNKKEPWYQKLAKYRYDKAHSLGDWTPGGREHMTGSWSELDMYNTHIKRYKETSAFNKYYKLWEEFGDYSVTDIDQLMGLLYLAQRPQHTKANVDKYTAAKLLYWKYHPEAKKNWGDYLSNYYYADYLMKKKQSLDKQLEKMNKDGAMNQASSNTVKESLWLYKELQKSTEKDSAKGSGFVSQLDPKYAYNMIGDETVAKAGCGPATAAMAINGLSAGDSDLMNATTALASKYKNAGGVKATYFADVLGRAGARTKYIDGSNTKSRIEDSLSSGKQVVLMGQDSSNKSKVNSPFGPGNHYVLAKGLSGNKVLINDPEQSGPKVYDKSILNNTKLGIAISGRGSETSGKATGLASIYNSVLQKIGSLSKFNQSTTNTTSTNGELGDPAVNSGIEFGTSETGNFLGSASANNIVSYARSFIGRINYSQARRYDIDNGGSYADCSSFVRHVFNKYGISLGTYTGAQVRQGAEVSKENLRPGDLVMFKNTCPTTNYRGVTHVGIYAGNGKFIHCSSSSGVKESELSGSYYVEHWLCGRRVISDNGGSALGSEIQNVSAKGSQYKPSDKVATITKVIAKVGAKGSEIKSNISESIDSYNSAKGSNNLSNANAIATTDSGVTNRLLETMVKLLSTIASNTSNVKEIVTLLTKILDKADSQAKGSQITESGRGGTAKSKSTTNKATKARKVLSNYSENDNIDMNNLIADLTSILTD